MNDAMVTFKFKNSNDISMYIQVDPWAGLYMLRKGEEIELAVKHNRDGAILEVDEYNDTRILMFPCSDEYYVIREGKPIHWTLFSTNVKDSIG
jgi:hypothetical protein